MWRKLKLIAIGLQIAAVFCNSALAQGVPIGALPNASTPLSGSEYTILSQNGTTAKATVNSFIAAGLTISANTLLGNNTGVSAAATGLSVAQVTTMLGLGTAAFRNTGTSGANVPLLSTANTWSSLQTFSGGVSIGGTLTVAALDVTGTTHLGLGTASYMTVTSTGVSANIASAAGTIELLPANGTVNVTGALNTSTSATIGNGLTVTLGGASITGGLQVTNLGATITGNSSITGNLQINSGSFTASGGAAAISPNNANVVISPIGTGLVTINPATAGTMNNMVIGGSTPLAGTFTIATGNSFIPNSATLPARGIYLPAANTVGIAGTSLNIASFVGVASATRGFTFTNSNGGNPTIDVTAGSLAITPPVVAAGTVTSAGLILSGAASPITLNGSVGTATNLLASAGAGATPTWVTAPTTYMTWAGVKTTNFNAVVQNIYCVDTQTTGAVTMTLPASPADGDRVQFLDCKSYFATVNFTVARNGKTIMGLAADMTVNVSNASSTLVYVSANGDWRMM